MLLNENQRVAQLPHLFWCAARLFQVLLSENQRVAQLLHLFWCAARLFQVLLGYTMRGMVNGMQKIDHLPTLLA